MSSLKKFSATISVMFVVCVLGAFIYRSHRRTEIDVHNSRPCDDILWVAMALADRRSDDVYPDLNKFSSSMEYMWWLYTNKIVWHTPFAGMVDGDGKTISASTNLPDFFVDQNEHWYIVVCPTGIEKETLPFAISCNVGFGVRSIAPTNAVPLSSINGYVRYPSTYGKKQWFVVTYGCRVHVFQEKPSAVILYNEFGELVNKCSVLPP